MALTPFIAGACFWINLQNKAHEVLIIFFVYISAVFHGPGQGPVASIYSEECFPLSHREVGPAFAVATNLFGAAVVGSTLPATLLEFRAQGTFGSYARVFIQFPSKWEA